MLLIVMILVILVHGCTLLTLCNFENKMGKIKENFKITILLFLTTSSVSQNLQSI